jgi:hypothetical protein
MQERVIGRIGPWQVSQRVDIAGTEHHVQVCPRTR